MFIRSVLSLVLIAFSGSAGAQEWPTRPIRMIVSATAGSSSDFIGRMVADGLSKRLIQSVVVENTGGGSITAFAAIARARPDGYTIGTLSGAFSTLAAFSTKLPYDSIKDFSMISFAARYPMVVAVKPDSPIKTLRQLIDKGKSPGGATLAMNLPGTVHHLVGEWINIEAGSSLQGVPYRGSPQMLTDLLGGRVDALIDTGNAVIPQIKAGVLKGIAVSSAERFPLIADVPTIKETLPDVQVISWIGFAAPAGVPGPIMGRLNRELVNILAEPEYAQKLAVVGSMPFPVTPSDMRKLIDSETAQWNRIIDIKKITRQ